MSGICLQLLHLGRYKWNKIGYVLKIVETVRSSFYYYLNIWIYFKVIYINILFPSGKKNWVERIYR